MATKVFNSERDIRLALNEQWDICEGRVKSKKSMDWLGMEDMLVAICNAPVDATDKVRAVRECVDAFTGRGHFDAAAYFVLLEDCR